MEASQLAKVVSRIVQAQPVTDMHTHVFAPAFGSSPTPGGLLLWGIDELVTYHYLVAEVFRVVPAFGRHSLPYDQFWAMPKAAQADHIWKHLFVERTPVSEACRGVITTLHKLGLDPNEKSLEPYRRWFAQQNASQFVDRVMQIANVDSITMTNEVFSPHERNLWLTRSDLASDPRFKPVLRIDRLLCDWKQAVLDLRPLGYELSAVIDDRSVEESKRFLREWVARMKAIYIAVSLPPAFRYPAADTGWDATSDVVLERVILPVCEELGLPFAMMIGSRRGVNPALRDAADMGGKADIESLTNLLQRFPRNRFLVTMLSRENQHELCVAARKFGHMLVFGCWWFLNNPSLIEEMTRMRLELLGTSIVPQHSDARILDQLIYKWDHSRQIIAKVLTDKYADLQASGYRVTEEHIQRDARLLLRDNFRQFIAG